MKKLNKVVFCLMITALSACNVVSFHQDGGAEESVSRAVTPQSRTFEVNTKLTYDMREGLNNNGTPVTLVTGFGEPIGTISGQQFSLLDMEGQGFLHGGQLVKRVGSAGSRVYEVLDQNIYPWGVDELGGAYIPWKSAGVGKHVAPLGTDFYVKEFDGYLLPDGTLHDGWFKAVFTPRKPIEDSFVIFFGPGSDVDHLRANSPGAMVTAQWTGEAPQYVRVKAFSNVGSIGPSPSDTTIPRGGSVTYSFIIAPCGRFHTLEGVIINGEPAPFEGSYYEYVVRDILVDTEVEFLFSYKDMFGAEAYYTVDQDWGTGFGASVVIESQTTQTITDWEFEMRYHTDVTVTGLWGGVMTQEGRVVKVKSSGWNSVIKPGSSMKVGLNGTYLMENSVPSIRVLVSY